MNQISSKDIRNIAIIAHVDHGKTTLVDELLKQSGTIRQNQNINERVMDSMDLEREKGITIKAKNTAVHWQNTLINIVDTPGHADFGAEVERVMKMVDGVLLLVDAYEGPQAQTRFVIKKAIQQNLMPILVINKIDRENADPEHVYNQVLELLLELDATEEQFHAPVIYASSKEGFAIKELEDEHKDLTPLFETIVSTIPAPETEDSPDFRMLISNIDWNDFVGRVAIGKILSGTVKAGDSLTVFHKDGNKERVKVTKVFEYSGLSTKDSSLGIAGNIVGISGFNEVDIGETLSSNPDAEPLPFVQIDPPTIEMEFAVNDGPLAGRDGKKVTSRQIRERLIREMKTNISITLKETGKGTTFLLSARGAMQIAVLVEQMRREGYEVLVSCPNVITQVIDGRLHEPLETAWIEIPETTMGAVMKNLSNRKAKIDNIEHHNSGVTLTARIPTRGLIGFEFDLMNMTSGHGVMSHMFKEYTPYLGDITTRSTGTLISSNNGEATSYSLFALEDRGKLFITAGEAVYEGMIIGENPRMHDMPVNPTKAKQLTNFRAAGKDENTTLTPPIRFTLERAIEYIAPDEYVEATPHNLRLRKKILCPHERKRAEKIKE